VLPSLTACGLGDKSTQAKRIIRSVDLARAKHTAAGTYGVAVRIVDIPVAGGALGNLGLGSQDGGPAVDPTKLGFTPEFSLAVAMDFAHERAVLSLQKPFQVFDDLALYGLRYDAAPREARPWVTLDLRDLEEGAPGFDPTQDSPALVLDSLNPTVLVDLIAGALTGSVKRGAVETINGVSATRYAANFDFDKTLRDTRRRDYDEDRRKALEIGLDVMGLRGTVHSGEVWLDNEGLPRRFRAVLTIEPIRGFVIEVRLRLDLAKYAVPVTVTPPGPAEVVGVDTLVGFLRSVVPSQRASISFGPPQGAP
jgi:hypothetical protein